VSGGVPVLIAGLVLAAAIGASLLAHRARMPLLVLLLGVGMLIGSDGTGWVRFDDYTVARDVGTLALALILFEGGLTSSFDRLAPVLRPALGLAFVGTIVTAVIGGLAAWPLLGLGIGPALLLGASLASTDGAAVFGILRGSHLRPRLVATLEGEAGLNDPIAVLLVVGVLDAMTTPRWAPHDLITLFLIELTVGAACGLLIGRAGAWALERVPLPASGLQPLAGTAAAALSFGLAITLHGSGFLAVYLTGLVLGSAKPPEPVVAFHRATAWLAQITLFVVLGLLVTPSRLAGAIAPGTLVAIVLIVIARPVAVALGTWRCGFTARESGLLSWAGLRGGIPVVLATYPVIAGVPGSEKFFDVVFFTVLMSTLVQGMTLETAARLMGVLADVGPEPVAERPTLAPTRSPAPTPAAPPPPRAAPAAPPAPPAPPAPAAPAAPRPWLPAFGDPAHPLAVDDVAVTEHVLGRADAPAALVRLRDGRHAISGSSYVAGTATALHAYARLRALMTTAADDRGWWSLVAATLSDRLGDEHERDQREADGHHLEDEPDHLVGDHAATAGRVRRGHRAV
jgi:NhaP-type Na+/H+ and K+/H+ antiporter